MLISCFNQHVKVSLKSDRALLAKAEDDFRRNEQLYKSGAISFQTVNQKRADRDSALVNVAQALALQARNHDCDCHSTPDVAAQTKRTIRVQDGLVVG